jgi:alpha-glucosidase (family GH31 glycosyl hydrolase)
LFFAGSAPQAFEFLTFGDDPRMILNYITLSGDIEIYAFFEGYFEGILRSYRAMFGTPTLPPFYALGLHHGSNGYDTLDKAKSLVSGY